MTVLERLQAAESDADVLAALARGIDPDGDTPTPEALAEWWPECPEAVAETESRLAALVRCVAVLEDEPSYKGLAEYIGRLFPTTSGLYYITLDRLPAPVPNGGRGNAFIDDERDHPDGHASERDGLRPRAVGPLRLSRAWMAARKRDRKGCPNHPLAPLVLGWLARPPVVAAESRRDPLLPVVRSVTEAPEREAGRLAFGGILDAGDVRPGQLALFPGTDGPRVPLLELVDAHGVPTMAQGRGAPLELAVYVAACIMTPYKARTGRARIVTTVRELRTFLFGDRWQPGATGGRPGDWERVRSAALGTDRLWLPLDNGDLWRAVAVRKLPGPEVESGLLDRQVIFDVELPPGSSDGPPIDRPELSRLRRESGPRFRAFLATHSLAWRPGLTRVPHPGNRRIRVWTGNPDKYPVLTAEDRRRLAFGAADQKHRTRAEQDAAWERLPGAVILTRNATTQDGRQGLRIVPTEAAEAIRKRWDG